MKYPKEYLDEIKLRLKVSQVVGKTVQLKKRGKEFIGLSPFKNEKTPSFTVNDETTGGTLRLRVPTEKRYEAAGIKKLWDVNTGNYITGFPFELSEEFLDFQKEYLLI